MNKRTPPCCENCPKNGSNVAGHCSGRLCPKWKEWFTVEWYRIRRAAQALKNNGRK